MSMSNKDITKLTELAKEKLKKGVSKEEALRSFVRAGILNKEGKFTKPYENLARVVKQR